MRIRWLDTTGRTGTLRLEELRVTDALLFPRDTSFGDLDVRGGDRGVIRAIDQNILVDVAALRYHAGGFRFGTERVELTPYEMKREAVLSIASDDPRLTTIIPNAE